MTEVEIKQAAETFAKELAFLRPTKEVVLSVKNILDLKRDSFIAGAEANALQWIPVSERLPEGAYDLLVVNAGSVSTGFYFNEDWYFRDLSSLLRNVTHWTPLPSPPNQQP